MKSKLLFAIISVTMFQSCNKPNSTVKAAVEVSDAYKVQLSQSEIEKIVADLRSKSEDKQQLLDAEAGLKAVNYNSYAMDLGDRALLKAHSHILSPGAQVIVIHYSKGKHNELGENISARLICAYSIDDKGQYVIEVVTVEYIGKTYGA